MSIQHGIYGAVEVPMSASEGIDIICTFKVAHNLFDELNWETQSCHNAVEKIIMGNTDG